MMSITSGQVRAAALAAILAMVPASTVFGQAHKGHHSGKQGAAGQNQGQQMVKAAQAAKAAKQAAKATTNPQASTSNSQNGATSQGTSAHQNNANTNKPRPSNASLVTALHSTRTQLAQAGHDYRGHRARAMEEINAAIKLLAAQAGRSNTGNTGLTHSGTTAQPGNTNSTTKASPSGTAAGNSAGTGNSTKTAASSGTGTGSGTGQGQGTSQTTSNAQLLAAQQSLQSIESQMDTNGMNSHGFVQAKSSLQNAIRELNLALNDL